MSAQTPSEQERDEALKETFPASDPPANSGITGPEKSGAGKSGPEKSGPEDSGSERTDKQPRQRDVSEQPTGTPTSDRHAAETAHHGESDKLTTPKR